MFFPSPVLVMRASMLVYPFRTSGRTVATKTPLRPLTAMRPHGPTTALLGTRSSSLRSPPRVPNSRAFPKPGPANQPVRPQEWKRKATPLAAEGMGLSGSILPGANRGWPRWGTPHHLSTVLRAGL